MSRILNNEEIEMLRRFFDYDLSEKELGIFQEKLETDKDFAKEIEHYRKANNAVDQVVGFNSTTEDAPSFDGKKKTTSVFQLIQRYLIPLAAIIVLCVGIRFLFFENNTVANTNAVIAECNTYTEMITKDILRGEQSDIANPEDIAYKELQKNMELYKAGNNNGLAKIEELAHSNTDKNVQEIALWVLVNIAFQEGDIAKAKKGLTEIKNNPDFNSATKATNLLKQLK